jgi:hypothetical protein
MTWKRYTLLITVSHMRISVVEYTMIVLTMRIILGVAVCYGIGHKGIVTAIGNGGKIPLLGQHHVCLRV